MVAAIKAGSSKRAAPEGVLEAGLVYCSWQNRSATFKSTTNPVLSGACEYGRALVMLWILIGTYANRFGTVAIKRRANVDFGYSEIRCRL